MAIPRNKLEVETLEKFKPSVEDLKLDDGTIMRYLRARDYNLEKTEESIRTAIQWKEDIAMELAQWEAQEDLMCNFKAYKTGMDCEGRVVVYVRFSEWLPARPLFDSFTPRDFLIFAYQTMTHLYKRFQQDSKQQQFTVIWDNDAVGFSDMFYEVKHWTTMQALIDVLKMVDACFPETLYKGYFINSAWAFTWGFSFVKPFMKTYTLNKIFITGYEEKKWKQALFETIPSEAIPSKFGGTATLEDIYEILFRSKSPNPAPQSSS